MLEHTAGCLAKLYSMLADCCDIARLRRGHGKGSMQSSKDASEASHSSPASQRPSKDIPIFADFDRPTRRSSLALPVAPRRDENPVDDVRLCCPLACSALHSSERSKEES